MGGRGGRGEEWGMEERGGRGREGGWEGKWGWGVWKGVGKEGRYEGSGMGDGRKGEEEEEKRGLKGK